MTDLYDCLLIATSTEACIETLKKSIPYKKPILVEKPVALKPKLFLN